MQPSAASSADTNTMGADNNADLVRGVLIALGLLGLCLGAFALVASHGRLHVADALDRIVTFVAPPPAPKPQKKRPVPAATEAPLANPSAGAGLSPDGDGPGGAGGPAPGAVAGPGEAPAPATAAQALRQVLQRFRGDPRRTSSITISSSGKIAQGPPGPLTHDGLPMDALDGATMITGSAPARSTP